MLKRSHDPSLSVHHGNANFAPSKLRIELTANKQAGWGLWAVWLFSFSFEAAERKVEIRRIERLIFGNSAEGDSAELAMDVFEPSLEARLVQFFFDES